MEYRRRGRPWVGRAGKGSQLSYLNMEAAGWDTIIVGGGLSGAACFSSLAKDRGGHLALLLEARDRFGGRSCTEKVAGFSVDTGGQWLGRCHSTLLSFCDELGLTTEAQSFPSCSSLDEAPALIEMAYYRLRPLTPDASLQVAAFQEKLTAEYRRLESGTVEARTASGDGSSCRREILSTS